MYIIKRLWRYVAAYRYNLIFLVFVALVGVSFEVAKPLPLKIIFDYVLGGQAAPPVLSNWLGTPFVADKPALLRWSIGLLLFVTLGSALVSFWVMKMTVQLAQKLVYDLSVDFYRKLQQMSLSFYGRHQTGDLLQRMNADVFIVYFLVAQIVLPAITSLVCLGIMFYIMLLIDVQMALLALLAVPLLAVALAAFATPMNNTTMLQYQKQGALSSFVQQSLVSMKLIQSYARESYMYIKLETAARNFGKAFQTATLVSTGYDQLTKLITGLASTLLIGLGAYKGLNGHVSAGDLFIFLGYITALYGPVNSLSTAVGAAIALNARGRRIYEILDSDETVPEKPNPIQLKETRGELVFENVSFYYKQPENPNVRPTLQNINFRVAPGQIIAIIGPTGTGKTTLISLINRFYDPVEGRILLDDRDLREYSVRSLRENISIVLQDPILFPMSIADNIAFGNPEASFEEIQEAAQMAEAHDFIVQLPGGYDTSISEAGASLSGGEKQRISLARAFLKKAPVMILDEPTSALDALTEGRIFQSLSQFAKGKTVILISHRLSAIRYVDQIIALQHGKIVESGTHHSLLERDGLYAKMFKNQLNIIKSEPASLA